MFDTKNHIEKMQPVVNKFVAYLKTKGIEFSPIDSSGLRNITLTKGADEIKISQHSFYRFSGISCLYEEKGEGEKKNFKIIEVTDEMFMNIFMKPIVESLFNPKLKK